MAHPFVCLRYTQALAKAVRWNEMPFGRDTCVVASNIVFTWTPVPMGRGDLGTGTPVHSDATYHQITLALVHSAAEYIIFRNVVDQGIGHEEKKGFRMRCVLMALS